MTDLKMPLPPTPRGDAPRAPDGPCCRCRQTRPRFGMVGVGLSTDLVCARCWSLIRESHLADDH